MFIKRNRSRQGGKTYTSVLLVEGIREPVVRSPGRPRKGETLKTRVRHRTLANLSRLPDVLVKIIERHCRGEALGENVSEVSMGPCYGVLAGLHALAGELGIVAALGTSREAKLALFMIYARIAKQGSRLAAVRWAEDHAVAAALGLEFFNEDDLYGALDWLAVNQSRIEEALAPEINPGAVFFYDVTSSYFEGQHNEWAAHGYNRDGKRYKKQVVVGLMTDAEGEPLAIRLYPGNTSDPKTFGPAVETMKVHFGAREVVMVGDRGMIKKLGRQVLDEAGFRYVTALTDPQIRKLLAEKVLTAELFDEQPLAMEHQGRRLILRCNPATRQRERQRRLDQWRKLQARLEVGNGRLAAKPRAQVQTLFKQAQKWLTHYGFESWIQLQVQERKVLWSENPAVRAELELLDGCYVLETDLQAEVADAATVNQRYMGLMEVERDFRTMKTGLLEIRPIFLRKANRTTGHALVTMLALKLVRALDRKVAPLGLTVEDAMQRLGGVRLVSLGAPDLGLWRLPQHFLLPQQEVLDRLPPIPAPRVSLKNTIRRRLSNPRRGRDSTRK
jgi:hypothetical protein